MEIAIRVAQSIDWASEIGQKATLTGQGRSKLFLESVRPTSPALTFQDAFSLFHIEGKLNLIKLDEFFDLYCMVNDISGVPKDFDADQGDRFEMDRSQMYRDLFELHGMTPTEAAKHTPSQLKAIIGRPERMTFKTQQEYNQHFARSVNGKR